MKARAGRPPLSLTRSVKRASNPMETKASENQMVRSAFRMPPTCFVVAGGIKKENRIDTMIKPRTNFGKRSHITPALGRSPGAWSSEDPDFFLKVHQMASI